MSRKKKQRSALRRNRPVLANKAKPGVSYEVSFDEWKSQMPQWLKDAENAIEAGRSQEAIGILSPERTDKVLRELSGPEKILVICGMAQFLCRLGKPKEAKVLYEEILKTHPTSAVYNELARISKKIGNLKNSASYLFQAMEKDPDNPSIWCNLGSDLILLGQTQKGIDLMRKAVEKMPDNQRMRSSYLFRLHNLPNLDPQEMFNEHKKWAQIHTTAIFTRSDHNNIPDLQRRLRIGYISPDFRAHSVAVFFDPILESHDRQNVELYGYGDIEIPDKVTEQFRKRFDHYRNIRNIDDKSVADLIEQDQIDILVDLAGHTGGSRLRVLAYKPAPLQATYLGYFDTTGMDQVDYFITDKKMSPENTQPFHTEKLALLPDSCLCYKPVTTMPVVESPMIKNEYVTFAMFGNATKINPFIISLWASVMKQCENSRMLLMFKGGGDEEVTEHYKGLFEKFGIPRSRLHFYGRKPFFEYMEIYGQVDIVLDTYPYNGGTTTCDALWMGVPVVSLVGKHHFSRVGLSVLSAVGLEFFAASTPDEFVAKTITFAAKPEALEKIRNTMRDRMAVSPLCNKKLFIENLEKLYRNMWEKWCSSKGEKIQKKASSKNNTFFSETNKMKSATEQMNCLGQVKNQYENYPYPFRDPEDEKKTIFLSNFCYLAKINHYCFKGKQNFSNFKLLDAGGGTGDVIIMFAEQLRDTDAQVVYLDMSSASMEIVKRRAEIRKLDNIKYVNGSILDIEKMGLGKFDYINCTGVLHHLESPDDGLKILKNSLKENGAIGIMVYGQYGRTAIYQMQEMLSLINAGQQDVEIMLRNTKAILDSLPSTNAFKKVESFFSFPKYKNDNTELHDLFLHSQDRAYTVPQLYQWVDDCGLNFVDFAEKKTSYKPQTFIKDQDLLNVINKISVEKQQAVAELINCSLKMHFFYVSTDTDTIADPADMDNIPFYYRYCAFTDLYDKIKDAPTGAVIKLEDLTDGNAKLIIGKYTKQIIKHLSGNNSLKDIFQLVGTEIDNGNKPDDEEFFHDFMNIYEPLNLLGLVVLRHRSVPVFKTEMQIQNRIKEMYN